MVMSWTPHQRQVVLYRLSSGILSAREPLNEHGYLSLGSSSRSNLISCIQRSSLESELIGDNLSLT
jgi:hypothetical protein